SCAAGCVEAGPAFRAGVAEPELTHPAADSANRSNTERSRPRSRRVRWAAWIPSITSRPPASSDARNDRPRRETTGGGRAGEPAGRGGRGGQVAKVPSGQGLGRRDAGLANARGGG